MPVQVADRIKSYEDRELVAKQVLQPQRRQQQQQQQQQQNAGVEYSNRIVTEPTSTSTVSVTPPGGPGNDPPAIEATLSSITNRLGGRNTTLPTASRIPVHIRSGASPNGLGATSGASINSRAGQRLYGQEQVDLPGASAGLVKGTHAEHPEHVSNVTNAVGRQPCPHHKHAAWEGSQAPSESKPKQVAAEQKQTAKEPQGSNDIEPTSQKEDPTSPRKKFARLDSREQPVSAGLGGSASSEKDGSVTGVSELQLQLPETKIVTVTAKAQRSPDEKPAQPVAVVIPMEESKIGIQTALPSTVAHQDSGLIRSDSSRVLISNEAMDNFAGEKAVASTTREDLSATPLSATTVLERRASDSSPVARPDKASKKALTTTGAANYIAPCKDDSTRVVSSPGLEASQSNAPNAQETPVQTTRRLSRDAANEQVTSPARTTSRPRARVAIPEAEISVQKHVEERITGNARISQQSSSPEIDIKITNMLPHERAVEVTSGPKLKDSSSRSTLASSTNGEEQHDLVVCKSPTTAGEAKRDDRDVAIETAIVEMNVLLADHREALKGISTALSQGLQCIDADFKEKAPTDGEIARYHASATKAIPEFQKHSALISQLIELVDASVAEWNTPTAITTTDSTLPVRNKEADQEQGMQAGSMPRPPVPKPSLMRGSTSTPELSRSGNIQTLPFELVTTIEVAPLGAPSSKCYVLPVCRVMVRPCRRARGHDASSSYYGVDYASDWKPYGAS